MEQEFKTIVVKGIQFPIYFTQEEFTNYCKSISKDQLDNLEYLKLNNDIVDIYNKAKATKFVCLIDISTFLIFCEINFITLKTLGFKVGNNGSVIGIAIDF